MNAHTIGVYKVPDGGTYTLTVPEDEVSRIKITAIVEKMEAAEDDVEYHMMQAVLLGVLLDRPTEEVWTMVPVETITAMMEDFKVWTDHLRPVQPC